MTEDKYREIFEYYNRLGLIKHRKLTPEMRSAIDIARRRGDYEWDMLITLLNRHKQIVDLTAGNEYPVRPRPLAVFFGQRVHNGSMLICSEYADDGAKWLLYKDGNPGKRSTAAARREEFERPVENYDHLAVNLFEEDTP